jgi:hypothetical protein
MKKWTKKENDKLKELSDKFDIYEVSKKMNRSYKSIDNKCRSIGIYCKPKETYSTLDNTDIVKEKQEKDKLNQVKSINKKLIEELEIERKKVEASKWIMDKKPKEYKITETTKKHEATAVIVASDWHIEEIVEKESVNMINEYNLEIAEKRAKNFFSNALRLIKKEEKDVTINKVVLALLGDFISGYIHEELIESNSLSPTQAIYKIRSLLKSGIDFLLNNTEQDLVLACCNGNHPRISEKYKISTAYKNSYEWLLYNILVDEYSNEKRIKFVMNNGYFTMLDIFNYKIRFHHGDHIKYGGGIGGITIPVNKAIAQWNKMQSVDLDVFGHFHQMISMKNFVCNGSLVGYNAYAMSIKAEYERPQQTFFLIDKEKGKSIYAPIWVE